MAYNFTGFKKNIKDVEEWLKKEFSGIRTGRANPALLDDVKFEAYGAPSAINMVGTVSIEGPSALRITLWDNTVAKAVEKGIVTSDLGLSVTIDDKGLRVVFPQLTSDRRGALVKMAKQKLEDARVTLRGEREKVIKDIDAEEKKGGMSEDEKFRLKAELQKMLDETNRNLDGLFAKKEKEITE